MSDPSKCGDLDCDGSCENYSDCTDSSCCSTDYSNASESRCDDINYDEYDDIETKYVRGLHPFIDANRETIQNAVEKDGHNLYFAPLVYRNDEKIVIIAMQTYVNAFRYASERLHKDKSFVLKAIQMGCGLRCVLSKFKDDKEVVLDAIEQNSLSFKDASRRLRNDKAFIVDIFELHGYTTPVSFFQESFNENNPHKPHKRSTYLSIHWLKYASNDVLHDREFMVKLSKNYHLFTLSKFAKLRLPKGDLDFRNDFLLNRLQRNPFQTFRYQDKFENFQWNLADMTFQFTNKRRRIKSEFSVKSDQLKSKSLIFSKEESKFSIN
jgi:hypothetical protein